VHVAHEVGLESLATADRRRLHVGMTDDSSFDIVCMPVLLSDVLQSECNLGIRRKLQGIDSSLEKGNDISEMFGCPVAHMHS
jgi:hypothetical protein